MLDYTKRAKNYDKKWQYYCLPSFSKPLQILDLNQDASLLDVGCGTGIFLAMVEKKFPATSSMALTPIKPCWQKPLKSSQAKSI